MLEPLDRDEVAAQVRAITGVAPPAAMVDQMVAARAAGDPFFTEELLAAGTAAEAVPATLRDVLLTGPPGCPRRGGGSCKPRR